MNALYLLLFLVMLQIIDWFIPKHVDTEKINKLSLTED